MNGKEKTFGLIGKKLGHSFSPQIHALLGSYGYVTAELPDEKALEAFFKTTELSGFNVTVPYKQKAFSLCDVLTDRAKAIGAVNTVIRTESGARLGDNTDAAGFAALIRKSGLSPAGKKTLIIGNGGVSRACRAVLTEMKADCAVLSHAENTEENLKRFRDTEILVNCTPVGMFPRNGESPVSLGAFPHLRAVYDVIANPAKTALCLEAEARGIPAFGGVYMLVMQAAEASALFTGRAVTEEEAEAVYEKTAAAMENIVLIGMPGVGKTSVGRELASLLNRPFFDSDEEIEKATGLTPAEWIKTRGEEAFRAEESGILSELGKKSGAVIATGGGAVLCEENYASLRQNGKVVFLTRPLDELETKGRPLSDTEEKKRALYEMRLPLYRRFRDAETAVGKTPRETAELIRKELNR